MSGDERQANLSVIIPIYNAENYLRECLDSVVGQLRRDDQLILVNDGSTDASGAICEQYAKEDRRIRMVHQANLGVAGARNTGLRYAEGDYIAWIDPDDWIEPNWREKIGEELESQEIDILVFDHILCRGAQREYVHYGREPGEMDVETLLADVVEDRIIQSGLCNKVMRSALYEKIRFDEKLKVLEDYDVLHRLIMKAEKVTYLPENLYNYRIHDRSLTHLRGLDVSFDSFCVARKRRKEILASGRRCSPLGMVLQARWFLHFYYMDGSHPDFRRERLICCFAILSSAPAILRQGDISGHEKMRRLFWALPGVDRLYRRRKPKMT